MTESFFSFFVQMIFKILFICRKQSPFYVNYTKMSMFCLKIIFFKKSFLSRRRIFQCNFIELSHDKITLLIGWENAFSIKLFWAAILFFKMAAGANLHKFSFFCIYFFMGFKTIVNKMGHPEN